MLLIPIVELEFYHVQFLSYGSPNQVEKSSAAVEWKAEKQNEVNLIE